MERDGRRITESIAATRRSRSTPLVSTVLESSLIHGRWRGHFSARPVGRISPARPDWETSDGTCRSGSDRTHRAAPTGNRAGKQSRPTRPSTKDPPVAGSPGELGGVESLPTTAWLPMRPGTMDHPSEKRTGESSLSAGTVERDHCRKVGRDLEDSENSRSEPAARAQRGSQSCGGWSIERLKRSGQGWLARRRQGTRGPSRDWVRALEG